MTLLKIEKELSQVAYREHTLIIDAEDYTFIEGLLNNPDIRISPKACSQGLRVQADGKVTHLASALLEHAKNELVRPIDGNWFNLSKDNLKRVRVST